MRRMVLSGVTAVALLAVTACDYNGLNDFALPGTQGDKPGSYVQNLVMADVGDLVPNNPVRFKDVNVGVIKKIKLDGWTALVTISLNPEVRLPANVTARIGQASLLGAKYIELAVPAGGGSPEQLAPNSTLGLSQTGAYTQTEDLLASVALLLNGGGLQHIRTIAYELNDALGGREPQFRALLTELNTFVTGLDAQKQDIVRAIDGIDRLSARLAEQNEVIDRAIDDIPPALEVLNEQRSNLTSTLQSLGNFGAAADDVISRGGDDLATNVDNLRPALKGLADAGDSLTRSLNLAASVLFPVDRFGEIFRGDYVNFYVTIDMTLGTLDQNFLTGTPLAGKLGAIEKALAAGRGVADQAVNPLLTPLAPQGGVPAQELEKLPGVGGLTNLDGRSGEIPDHNGADGNGREKSQTEPGPSHSDPEPPKLPLPTKPDGKGPLGGLLGGN